MKVKQSLTEQAEGIKAKILKRKECTQLKLSQSLVQLTTLSSESSLEKQKDARESKLKIDFTKIINENEDEEDSIQEEITPKKHYKIEVKPI